MINWDSLDSPSYVNEGDKVLAPFKRYKIIRCKVVTAAGYHALVSNEKHNFNKWFHINHLRIEKTK